MSFNIYKSDFIKLRGWRKCQIELAMGVKQTMVDTYFATGLSALLIVIAKAILIGNRLLHRLNAIVGPAGHN
jgi:hypothetical protein